MKDKKDIETMLQASHMPKPKRGLSADFNQKVLAGISDSPPKKKREWWQRFLQFRLLPKPLLLACGALLVLVFGGAAYAAVHWPNISAFFAGEKILPSGDRIVAVDTENCLTFQNIDGTAKPDGKNTIYYEIKKDSTLTNEQVVAMVRSVCEENVANNMVSRIIKEEFAPPKKGEAKVGEPTVMSGSGFVIKAIDGRGLTLGYDDKWFTAGNLAALGNGNITYHRLAPNVKVYDRGRPVPYDNLRPGDSIVVVVRDEHPLGSEVDPHDTNHWDDPDLIVIEAIVKVPTPSFPSSEFYTRLGIDFVRAEPCKQSSSGFCRVYEFTKDDLTKGVRLRP